MMKKYLNSLVFGGLLLTLCLIYSYPGILNLRPQGVHQWRQTDCLSITTNFYERGMNFFEPEIHCLISDDLTSGKTAGECPITYYTVAGLWKIFGKHEWIYRLFTMLLFLTGIFCFFKTLENIHKNIFWNAALALSIMTAPLLVYYGSGFLSDVHAFSFVLIASHFILKYAIAQRKRYMIYAIVFFVIAGLLKITALILFLTLGGLFVLENFGLVLWPNRRIFVHRLLALALFVFGLVVVLMWYVYAESYNSVHGGKYTFNDIWPVWKASAQRIQVIAEKFRAVLIYQIFPKPWLYTLGLMFLLLIMNFRKLPKFISLGLVILLAGCLSYVLLWFEAFDVHDYYLTNLYILPAAFIAGFYFLLKTYWPSLMQSKQLQVVLAMLLVWGIFYTSANINMRFYPKEERLYLTSGSQEEVDFYKYNKWAYDQNEKFLETVEPYLEKIGVHKDDLVITHPDPSFNINLYLMNRRGWSAMGDESNTKEGILKRIERGAKFLIVTNNRMSVEKPFLADFMQHPVGAYHNVLIYDLRSYLLP